MSQTIEVQNVGQPGKVYRADAAKYADMRAAMEKVAAALALDIDGAAAAPEVKRHLVDLPRLQNPPLRLAARCVRRDWRERCCRRSTPRSPPARRRSRLGHPVRWIAPAQPAPLHARGSPPPTPTHAASHCPCPAAMAGELAS